ncbi:MAG: T9SS type A sorting domain-containing protein [Bacteroidales bacterium]|nr:T9SS type A sorting domain-containing protein [Bacteroidales bacterium]
MKKTALLTALLLAFSFMGFAQEWHGITSNTPSQMKKALISSTETETVVEVSIDGYYTQNVKTPNGKQVIVRVDRMASVLEAGAPDLPYDAVPVMIGDLAEMKVSVLKSNYVDIENVEVAPSKGNISRQIDPEDVPYTYGEMYSQDAFWPAAQATLDAPYIIRDFRGQNIVVYPFAYNPVTKTLRVYTSMTIAMTKVSDNGENPKAARKSNTIKMSNEQKAQYERRFINFGESSAKYTFLEDEGEMLVICPEQYMAGMQPFVDWKNQSGRPTTMVSVATAGGNNANNIKNYITSVYNDPDRNLAYVLFVGDYADITPHPFTATCLGYSSTEYSDNWFVQIEGTDHYAELLIGRFSVQNDTHLATHVNKVLYYERDMPASVTWVNQGLGIGSTQEGSGGHNGEYDNVHIHYITEKLLAYTYANVTEHHAPSANATGISNTINQGVSIINYCNHGSETSWGVASYSTSHVNALTNDNMLPIVWSVACLNGKFNYGSECFAEAWLRATDNSNGTPTGAVGGMFSWMSQPWAPPMWGQDEMDDILVGTHGAAYYNHTLGGASLNGSMYVMDKSSGANGTDTYDTWILFGDPSMIVRTDNPTAMNVSTSPSVLMVGMSELEVTADAEYGIATLSGSDGVIASAKIVGGVADLTFAPVSSVETLTLTVLGYNKVTEVLNVEVLPAEGAYVTVDAFTPGNVPVAEEQNMSMTFRNVGVEATTSTTNVLLSSESGDITFADNEGSFGALGADETVTLNNEFRFTIASGVADGTVIQIDVTATCGSEVWTGKARITVGAPIVEFDSFQGAGGFDPGQTFIVAANFKNVGHYMATNAVVTASSTSSYVSFASETATVGTIDPDGTGTALFTVTVDEACPTSETLSFNFNLTADNGVTATGSGVLKNSCNIVFNLADSWGDGWNGAKLTVAYSDGTPTEQLTFTTGNSETIIREIGTGVTVTLGWISGSYDSECSFTVAYQDGDQITSASNLSTSYNFQFTVNCGGEPVTVNPVQNLVAEVEGTTVTLTWDAPSAGTPMGYIVSRNGVELEEVTDRVYVDENLMSGVSYNYTVVAHYDAGNSLPVSVIAEINAIGENEIITGIYPNPAEDVLNIVANQSYEYQLINSVGQVVLSGNAEGNAELNVSDLNSGVYFLKVVANGSASINKVVIK